MELAKKTICFSLAMVLLLAPMNPYQEAYGAPAGRPVKHQVARALRIVKINSLTIRVVQGKNVAFPATVKALMSDGSIAEQPVLWSSSKISTATVKSFALTGKVKGYTDKVKLTVKVLPKTPTGVAAKKSYTGWVKITWNTVAGASGYNLYYSNDEESWEKWNTTVTKNSAMLSGVENGVELYFRVASVANGIESLKSPSTYFTMLSAHLPQYPNLPIHPDYTFDKVNGSYQAADGVYYYKYSTSRVGTDFAETYNSRILQKEDFVNDPKKMVKSSEAGVNAKYGEYTQETTDKFFTSADETYVIRRVVISGLLEGNPVSEDYFLVFRK